ncbi:hypothetical protein VPH46_09430 [Sphingomonas sp. MJ1 (PH-R8)]|uniref:hypothetical protein n=1 Tax=unclassified Sphingomonas TaxID=196159 RepID=UPI001EF59110|nr:hypothetical protein [Sphingomonas sp. ACRSK]MCG7347642.1 hypothetical protein [Sphingomonas sp. ACRSK]
MARVRNDPARYITRSGNLPPFDRDAAPCPKKSAERERSYAEAPISEGFYIDLRRRPRD